MPSLAALRAPVVVAVVTGGSRGAGRQVVEALAALDVAVVVVYLHDQGDADAVVDGVLDRGGAALTVRADVTDDLDVERAFDEAIAAFGGIDVVVHAAPRGDEVVLDLAARRVRPGGIVDRVTDPDGVARVVARVERWLDVR